MILKLKNEQNSGSADVTIFEELVSQNRDFKFAHLHFRRLIHCLGSKSLLHGAVYTNSLKDSEDMTFIYSQSSRSSFRKIQIFEIGTFCTSAVLFLV